MKIIALILIVISSNLLYSQNDTVSKIKKEIENTYEVMQTLTPRYNIASHNKREYDTLTTTYNDNSIIETHSWSYLVNDAYGFPTAIKGINETITINNKLGLTDSIVKTRDGEVIESMKYVYNKSNYIKYIIINEPGFSFTDTISFEYNENNLLIKRISNSITSTYFYNDNNQLKNSCDRTPNNNTREFTYEYHVNGKISKIWFKKKKKTH